MDLKLYESLNSYIKIDSIDLFEFLKTIKFSSETEIVNVHIMILNRIILNNSNFNIFEHLFKTGLIDPNDESIYGHSILTQLSSCPVMFHRAYAFKANILLKYGADVNFYKKCDNTLNINQEMSKLSKKIDNFVTLEETLKYIQSNKYTPTHASKYLASPLLYSLMSNNDENAQFLIDHGANMHKLDDDENNFLHYYAQNTNMSRTMLGFLFIYFDVNSKNNKGETFLHIFAKIELSRSYKTFDVLSHLLEYGFDINSQDDDGNTVLHILSNSYHCFEKISELLVFGANPNIKNVDGNTALYLVLQQERIIDLLNLFLQHKANFYDIDKYGNNAFLYAKDTSVFRCLYLGISNSM